MNQEPIPSTCVVLPSGGKSHSGFWRLKIIVALSAAETGGKYTMFTAVTHQAEARRLIITRTRTNGFLCGGDARNSSRTMSGPKYRSALLSSPQEVWSMRSGTRVTSHLRRLGKTSPLCSTPHPLPLSRVGKTGTEVYRVVREPDECRRYIL